MTTIQPTCQVHKVHIPKPLRIVKHHIQPLGMGGPDIAANWLWVCDTGHFNIHRLLGLLLNGTPLPKGVGTRTERSYAQLGYDAWIKAGKPGHPVFEEW